MEIIVKRAVAQDFGLKVGDINSKVRTARIALARQVAMYLCHVVAGMTYTEIARSFKRDRATVVHGIHKIEDMRDKRIFDQRLDYLEQWIVKSHSGT